MPGGARPSVAELDGMTDTDCRAALGPLFEGAPRFLARLCAARPFGDADGLFTRARGVARSMPEADQLELIDAHPRLGAPPEAVSALSFVEQGYDRVTAPQTSAPAGATARTAVGGVSAQDPIATELARLNETYEARFGFRYCVFVAGRSRAELLPEFETALGAERSAEVARALEAVVDIAADRWARAVG